MKKFNSDLVLNPSFNSVTELTNTTFIPTNYVENRMATEQQISELYGRIVENEIRRDSCCRDIIVWEAHTQIVRMNTNTINTSSVNVIGGGVIISDWNENVSIGTMRRGLKYTVTFPLKWNKNLYYPITPERNNDNACSPCSYSVYQNNNAKSHLFNVQFRYLEDSDDIYGQYRCTTTVNNRRDFFVGDSGSNATPPESERIKGKMVNSGIDWGSFTRDVKGDGTVTITDHRKNTNYNVIRFYTQWTLNQCADGSLFSDNESLAYPNGRPDPVW